MRYQLLTFGLLLGAWLALSGMFDLFHVGLGILACALVTWWSSDLLFEDRERPLRARLREAWRGVGYLVWLMGQIVLANIHLLGLTLSPDGLRQVRPRIVRFKTRLRSDFARFLLANSITVTPGTITIKIVDDAFYVHAISEVAASGLGEEMERRIAAIFQDANGDRPGPPDGSGDPSPRAT